MSEYYFFPREGCKNLKLEIKDYTVEVNIGKEKTIFEKTKFIRDIENFNKYLIMIQKGKDK